MTAHSNNEPTWENLGLAGKGALLAAGTFISIGLFSMGSALPVLAESFRDTPHVTLLVQLIGSIVAPVFALCSPIAGRLVSRYGVRTIYLGSLLLFTIGGVGPALFSSLTAILLCRLLLAIGVAGAFTAGMAGIARVPIAQRQVLLGFTSFFGGAIAIAVFPIVGTLAQSGWRLAFLVHLLLLPTAFLMLRLPPQKPGVAGAGQTPSVIATGLLAGVPPSLLATAGMVGLAMIASSMYTPFYLTSIGIGEPARIGLILTTMAVCSLIGSGSYSVVHRWAGTRGMVCLGLTAIGAGSLTIGLASTLAGAIAGMGLMGAGLAIFGAGGYGAAIEAVGPSGNTGAAMGVITFALYGSQILFPLLSGTIGATAGPQSVFLLLGGLMVAAARSFAVSSATTSPFSAWTSAMPPSSASRLNEAYISSSLTISAPL